MKITGEKVYFYSVNIQTMQKEYFKLISAESIYNAHEQDTQYYDCKVKRCIIEKTGKVDIIAENDDTKDYYFMEEFEISVNKDKCRTVTYPSKGWLFKKDFTDNIIHKRKQ